MSFKYVIKDGHVVDPALHIDKIMDVEITDSKITRVGKFAVDNAQTLDEQTINAKGCFVVGGFIDYHTHFGYGNTDAGVPAAAACFPNGITTAVDGGSTGVASFEGFYQNIVVPSPVDVKTMLHVSSLGQVSHLFLENTDPSLFERDKILYFCHCCPV
jgi:dihydroorotase